ncbi:hypothetical protein C5B96_15900 [Subtercola sp. Z020]|uniref:hypothetical protein n=1 Tax=Subtercola sp. Z020 TaxID=2080582 RepID=UPI000CE77BCD|nr:hypothetical protein [Subtercola sp. Z020]PPF77354.1 hypothetical protein C5B96_15900 [Subtercola sp. Z020]
MPNGIAFLKERVAAGVERHPGPPAVMAAVGARVHDIREAAPLVLITVTRLLPHPALHQPPAPQPVPYLPRLVSVHEWDANRWFVTAPNPGMPGQPVAGPQMLGEIELVGCCYRVSFAADARGAAFGFESLSLAVEHFDEYAAALAL